MAGQMRCVSAVGDERKKVSLTLPGSRAHKKASWSRTPGRFYILSCGSDTSAAAVLSLVAAATGWLEDAALDSLVYHGADLYVNFTLFRLAHCYGVGVRNFFLNLLADSDSSGSLLFASLAHVVCVLNFFLNNFRNADSACSLFLTLLADCVGVGNFFLNYAWNADSSSSLFLTRLADCVGVRNFFLNNLRNADSTCSLFLTSLADCIGVRYFFLHDFAAGVRNLNLHNVGNPASFLAASA